MIVLDASVVAAWFIEGQETPASEALLDRACKLEFVAPALFAYEVANIFRTAEWKRRMTPGDTRAALDEL